MLKQLWMWSTEMFLLQVATLAMAQLARDKIPHAAGFMVLMTFMVPTFVVLMKREAMSPNFGAIVFVALAAFAGAFGLAPFIAPATFGHHTDVTLLVALMVVLLAAGAALVAHYAGAKESMVRLFAVSLPFGLGTIFGFALRFDHKH